MAVGQSVAVYDLGGGTFDTAILRRDEHGFALVGTPGGDDWLGGEDFDQQLIDHVLGHVFTRDRDVWQHLNQASTPAWQRARMVLRDDARGAKEALSATSTFTIAVGPEQDIEIEITRSELDDLIRDDLTNTIGVLDATIRDAHLTRDDIAAIYLTGGSSRIPLVTDLLGQYHPHTHTRPDPKTLVAHGATRRATLRPLSRSSDPAPLTLTEREQGTEIAREVTAQANGREEVERTEAVAVTAANRQESPKPGYSVASDSSKSPQLADKLVRISMVAFGIWVSMVVLTGVFGSYLLFEVAFLFLFGAFFSAIAAFLVRIGDTIRNRLDRGVGAASGEGSSDDASRPDRPTYPPVQE